MAPNSPPTGKYPVEKVINPRSVDPAEIERGLPRELRDGLTALRALEGLPAQVVKPVTGGNIVFVSLGLWNLSELADMYHPETERTAVFARYLRSFGQDHSIDDIIEQYGFATYPGPKFSDGTLPDNVRFGEGHALPLQSVLGTSIHKIPYWSLDWRDVTVSGGEDMTRLLPLIRDRLENP